MFRFLIFSVYIRVKPKYSLVGQVFSFQFCNSDIRFCCVMFFFTKCKLSVII